jgi:hypothetical protein
VHQKQPVPKVAVSIFSETTLLETSTKDVLIALYLFSDVQAARPSKNNKFNLAFVIM